MIIKTGNTEAFTKLECFKMMVDILDSAGNEEEVRVKTLDVEKLFKFLLPKQIKPTSNGEIYKQRFLATKTDVRGYLRNTLVLNNYAVYSNSHISLATPTDLSDGQYCPYTLKKVSDKQKLSTEILSSILGRTGIYKEHSFDLNDLPEVYEIGKTISQTQISVDLLPYTSYQKKYLDIVLNGEKQFDCAINESRHLCLNVNRFGTEMKVLIMPLSNRWRRESLS